IALVALQLSLTVTPASTSGTSAWQFASLEPLRLAAQVTTGAVVSLTVKVVVQVPMLPASSVAVTVIVCAPGPTSVPAAGLWFKLIALVALQLSLTVTPASTSGTAAWQFASLEPLRLAAQVTTGAVVSLTVKVVVQVPMLPAWSVAVTVIVCGPGPTSVPAAGL